MQIMNKIKKNRQTTRQGEKTAAGAAPTMSHRPPVFKHFVIDTSRNGNGGSADGQWCNPPNQAIGATPTTRTGNTLVDSLLWAKSPWGSDGPCNGGPPAGQAFWDYAITLAKNAGW
jgi:cellulase/cellobiase CelA1